MKDQTTVYKWNTLITHFYFTNCNWPIRESVTGDIVATNLFVFSLLNGQ